TANSSLHGSRTAMEKPRINCARMLRACHGPACGWQPGRYNAPPRSHATGSPIMTRIATPLTDQATRVLLLGSGELGKEVAIELQRFGVEVIAADRYADAPAMQVAHRSVVLDMLDG